MPFSSENGYVPISIETMIDSVRQNVNTQFGTTYTTDTFIGTNFYKYFYALIQRLQENEVKTSEIFLSLQQYFDVTNETILRPAVTPEGMLEAFAESDYTVSIKAPIVGDAGKLYLCALLDDGDDNYPTDKLAVCTLLKQYCVAGVVTQGTETETLVLTNGQAFDFKFTLPDTIVTKLRLTNTTSDNNQTIIKSTADIKADLLANIAARYNLGKDFEPQKYYSLTDAPWCSQVVLEWSTDGGSTYHTTVRASDFDELLTFALSDITLVEA